MALPGATRRAASPALTPAKTPARVPSAASVSSAPAEARAKRTAPAGSRENGSIDVDIVDGFEFRSQASNLSVEPAVKMKRPRGKRRAPRAPARELPAATESVPEEAEGFALLSQLAALGSPEGACGLAFCLLDGPGEHTRDELAAAALFERAAHAGLPQAMSELATMHFLGDGIPEDAILAAHWFRRAAEGGVPAAMYLWGECLLEGRGCARDASHAREWFLAAGKLGHRGARHRIITECAQEAADDERLEARYGRASGRRGSRWDSRDGTASREPES